jgi:hypothetical protein
LILTQRAYQACALDAADRGDLDAAYENAATVARREPSTTPLMGYVFCSTWSRPPCARRGAALAHVQAMLDTDVASPSPRLAMLVAGATALLDDGTNDAFERALTVADAARCTPAARLLGPVR